MTQKTMAQLQNNVCLVCLSNDQLRCTTVHCEKLVWNSLTLLLLLLFSKLQLVEKNNIEWPFLGIQCQIIYFVKHFIVDQEL